MMNILEISASLDGGGVDKLLFEFCRSILLKSKKYHFDFIVTSDNKGIFEKKLESMGCKIYHVKEMSKGFFAYVSRLHDIMINGKYDIVHDHMNQASMGSMISAKWARIPIRIAHVHTLIENERLLRKIKRRAMAFISKSFATNLCACSKTSARWFWGKNGKVHIINNAIDLDAFRFSQQKRGQIRNEMDIDNCLVIGNVARFSDEKNHIFMLKVLRELLKFKKAKLVFVGRGNTEKKVKNKAKKMGLMKDVIFLGIREDVPDLLNMMDVFILPSKYEGFPITLVEAQVNGLPVLASDIITREVILSDHIYFLPIVNSERMWSEYIIRHAIAFNRWEFDGRMLKFEMQHEAERLANYYMKLVNGHRN